jgi:type VI secretion system protein ImpG
MPQGETDGDRCPFRRRTCTPLAPAFADCIDVDPRLLRHYNEELGHLREMGAEFAQQFPKIAGRLGMDGIAVSDPYVERLLEGFAFLAARVQLKLDAEFPRFTQRLLEILYPQFLAPTPSMLVAQFKPDLNDPSLAGGVVVKRGSAMHSLLGKGDETACEFRTTQAVDLLPLEVAAASFFSFAPDLPLNALPGGQRVKAGLRIRLKLGGGLRFDQIALAHLPVYLSGSEEVAYKLYELSLGACLGMLVLPPERPAPWYRFVAPTDVRSLGFGDDEAVLPVTLRGFQGYRLLHEYAAFPQRFLFVDLHGLAAPLRRCAGDEIELVLLFSRAEPGLESLVDAGSTSLFCTPAINLFEKRGDRIHLGDGGHQHHVIADRTRPMDFEIYDVTRVTGHGASVEARREFLPFYCAYHTEPGEHQAYYTLQREPRLMSMAQKRNGTRSSYLGSEVFLSLVDPEEAPFGAELAQLSLSALVTNRDLPLQMPLGAAGTDFTLDASAPVASIRAIRGPSKPYSAVREGNVAWRFINHLSLNHLSLADTGAGNGAAALREMLELYGLLGDAAMTRQVEGLRSVAVRPLVRRYPVPGPVTFARGLEIALEVDELAFQGASPFLFGAVMEQFLTRHVSINSFVETVLRSGRRGEIMRWVPRCGQRPIV